MPISDSAGSQFSFPSDRAEPSLTTIYTLTANCHQHKSQLNFRSILKMMQQTGDRVGKLNVAGINAASISDVMQSRLAVLPSVPSQAVTSFAAVDFATVGKIAFSSRAVEWRSPINLDALVRSTVVRASDFSCIQSSNMFL